MREQVASRNVDQFLNLLDIQLTFAEIDNAFCRNSCLNHLVMLNRIDENCEEYHWFLFEDILSC